MGGTGVNVFYFTMNPKFKYKKKRFFFLGGGGGGCGQGARVSDFFTKNPNLKYFFGEMWGGGGAYWLGGTGVNVFYFTMNPNFKYKKKRFFFLGGGGGVWAGG